MKKFLSVLLSLITMFSCMVIYGAGKEDGAVGAVDLSAVDMTSTKKTEDVYIRDPCVLVYDNKYFMYGTGSSTKAGYGCYVSEDLENWAGPVNVFEADTAENFDGIENYWAPECHYYNGKFYLFATYKSSSANHRGVGVFRSESPLGPFTLISDGHITPHDWDSIDGTLYVDKNGEPWMVFVHEWTSMPDEIGDMSYAKLSDDLSRFVTAPVVMFKADEPLWTTGGVTDGPYMYRTSNDKLVMLWSNSVIGDGYGVGVAHSSNGEINGKWSQDKTPLYHANKYHENDGGHGMIFTALDGRMLMAIHSPNSSKPDNMTHAVFIELEDTGDTVRIKGEHGTAKSRIENFGKVIRFAFNKLKAAVKHFFKNIGSSC